MVAYRAGAVSTVRGDAAVLNTATSAFFNLHLQLQIEIARFVAATDDIVITLRLVLQCFTHHRARLNTRNGGICIPSREALTIEDLLVTGMNIRILRRG